VTAGEGGAVAAVVGPMTGGGTTASSTKVVETGAGLEAVDEVPAPFGSRMIGSTGVTEGLAMAEVTAYPSANPAKLAAITANNRRVRSTTHRMVRRGRNQDEMRMRIPSSSLAASGEMKGFSSPAQVGSICEGDASGDDPHYSAAFRRDPNR
jgi:hypothetical protein